jgi:hypothetical protein
MGLGQNPYVSELNLIVEGDHEFRLISIISEIFSRFRKLHLAENIAILPAGTASKIPTMARFVMAQKLKALCLFDYDDEGRDTIKEMEKNPFFKGAKNIMSLIETEDQDRTLEDMIGEQLYIKHVAAVHNIAAENIHSFMQFESQKDSNFKKKSLPYKVMAYFSKNDSTFQKGKVFSSIIKELKSIDNDKKLRESELQGLMTNFDKLFELINKKFAEIKVI